MRTDRQRRIAGLPCAVLALAVLVSGSGCDGGDPRRWFSGGCGAGGVCSGNSLCLDDRCTRPCVSETDCGDGLCFDGQCMLPEHACQLGKCEDGNACSVDLCHLQTAACQHELHQGTCDDGLPCTVGDECVQDPAAGPTCKAAPLCEPGSACDAAKVCDDGNSATADTCGADGKCLHQ